MSVWNFIKGAISEVGRVLPVILPLIRSLRQVSEPVDDIVAKVEGLLAQAETEGADFFVRNDHVFDALEEVAIDGQEALRQLQLFCQEARVFSELETPGRITVEEAAALKSRAVLLVKAAQETARLAGIAEEQVAGMS